jgi:hypothetical protein
MTGTWYGDFIRHESNDLVVILNWDGKAVSGMVNPGRIW